MDKIEDKVDVRFTDKPKGPKPELPRDAFERAEALVRVMGRLSANLDRETVVVTRQRFDELDPLIKEKQPLALACEELSRLLRIDRKGMAELPESLLRAVKDATQHLAATTRTNAEALRLNGVVQEFMVETIVTAVNRLRQTAPGVSYGPAGPTGRPQRGYGAPTRGPATSATLNTQL